MTTKTDDRPRRSRPLLRVLLPLLIAFVLGTLAMGYALTHWRVAQAYLGAPAPAAAPAVVAPPPQRAPVLVTPLPIGEVAALDVRVHDLEGRIGAIDSRARVASINADRAEALLVAFAARRALDRGTGLGYIEPLLRERFAGGQPQAVATIIAASRQPVTLDELRAGLEAVAPDLLGAHPQAGWWQILKNEVAGLIVLRRANTPAAQPADRVARAENAVTAGHVDRALVEVARLQGRDAAAGWIASARRYIAARQALDMIEATALLAPRPVLSPQPAASVPPAQSGAPPPA